MVLDVVDSTRTSTNQTYARQGIFDRRIYGYDPFSKSTTTNTFYTSLLSGDYGDAQGFEVTLRSLFSSVVMFDLNYSFSRSLQGRASPARVNYDSSGNATFVYDTDVNKRIPWKRISAGRISSGPTSSCAILRTPKHHCSPISSRTPAPAFSIVSRADRHSRTSISMTRRIPMTTNGIPRP